MITGIHALSVKSGKRNIQIQHDRVSQITIFDEPLIEPYEHTERRVINEVPLLQNIPMMDFQSKIAMLFRGPLTSQGIQVPLKGVFEVDIELQSFRSLDELPLLDVMKSVIDGLNNEIVVNDQSLYACSIGYKNLKTKPSRIKPSDVLSVALFERIGNRRRLIHAADDVNIYVVPKKDPLFLDYDNDALWSFDVHDQRDIICDALRADGMRIAGGGPIKLTLNFEGSIMDKDLDNMARVYFKLLENLGLQSRYVHRIDLAKAQAGKGCTRISLS
jgi:hypothetical protein